jgi:hypothetical protein
MRLLKRLVSLLIAAALVLALPSVSLAQLRGSYPPGFAALESGSQGPPAIDVFLPVFAYSANDIKDDQGHSLGRSPRVTSVLVAPSVSWVTNVKVLGANLGGMAMPLPFIKNSIEGRSLAVAGTFTYSDIFVEPIQLGWHPKGADFLAAYSAAVPTGKYALGALDNGGLGQGSLLPGWHNGAARPEGASRILSPCDVRHSHPEARDRHHGGQRRHARGWAGIPTI